LSIQVGATLDDSEDKRIVGPDYLDVVRLVDDAIGVGDRKVNSPRSLVSYEPGQDNVWVVEGWGVVFVPFPDFVVLHKGAIGMAERGHLMVNAYGKVELGMGVTTDVVRV